MEPGIVRIGFKFIFSIHDFPEDGLGKAIRHTTERTDCDDAARMGSDVRHGPADGENGFAGQVGRYITASALDNRLKIYRFCLNEPGSAENGFDLLFVFGHELLFGQKAEFFHHRHFIIYQSFVHQVIGIVQPLRYRRTDRRESFFCKFFGKILA